MEKLALSVPEACIALSVKKTTLYAMLARNKLRRLKIGRRTLITTASIRALVDAD